MEQRIFEHATLAALAAAEHAASAIRRAIAERGLARVVAATGASQIHFLAHLVAAPNIDWPRVELFHLDEYIGLGADHPASFARFIRERLTAPAGIERIHLLNGNADPLTVCASAADALSKAPIDITFAGVGENGHLAFNEPPADFATSQAFLIVALAERTRLQQVKEGWFPDIDAVPVRAITMSIPQILKSREVLCIATGARKAQAVELCFARPVSRLGPASALQNHSHATLFLDREAAALLPPALQALPQK